MYQYVTNGLGMGNSLQRLLNNRMDPGVLRPWAELDRYGNPTGRNFITKLSRNPDGSIRYKRDDKGNLVTNEANGQPVPIRENLLTNATATLPQEAWLRIDEAVTMAARNRLRLAGDLAGAVPYNIPDGMGTLAIQHATASGEATATISMDPIRRGERARPTMDTTIIPLPVIHADGEFTAREIAVSSNSGLRLDTTGIEMAAIAVAETVEQLYLGTASSYSFAGGTIYGLTNFPFRSTKVLTAPTAGGWDGNVLLVELLDMIKTLQDDRYYGPYVAYFSNGWNPYLADDYSANYAGSIRTRIMDGTPEIGAWRNLDFLTGYQIVLVQIDRRVVEAINGMGLTTVQWEEEGGMLAKFKVMTINIPRVKSDANGATGIVHGAAA